MNAVSDPHLPTRLKDAALTLISLAAFTLITAALLQSWRLALILAASLSAHELGHILLIVTHGVRWRLLFSPLGARLETPLAERAELSQYTNALIHLAGPLASLVTALVALMLGWLGSSPREDLARMANFSAQVALFNLLPLGHATDGGKFIDRVFDSLQDRDDWRIFWLPITWGVAVLGGSMLGFFIEHGMALVPPHALSYLLVLLWLLVGMLIEKRHEDPTAWKSPQAMTYRQAWGLMAGLGFLLLASTLLVTLTPFWLPDQQILTLVQAIQRLMGGLPGMH